MPADTVTEAHPTRGEQSIEGREQVSATRPVATKIDGDEPPVVPATKHAELGAPPGSTDMADTARQGTEVPRAAATIVEARPTSGVAAPADVGEEAIGPSAAGGRGAIPNAAGTTLKAEVGGEEAAADELEEKLETASLTDESEKANTEKPPASVARQAAAPASFTARQPAAPHPPAPSAPASTAFPASAIRGSATAASDEKLADPSPVSAIDSSSPAGAVGRLATTVSPLEAVATLRAAAEGMPGLLTGVAEAATAAIPHGPAPTGLANTSTAPPADADSAAETAPVSDDQPPRVAAGGAGADGATLPHIALPADTGALPASADSDPAQVARINNAAVQQVGIAAAAATAGDFGASALAPTVPPVVLPQEAVPADVSGLPTPPAAPALEPEVAQVLTSARGPEIETALATASQDAETATAAHDAEMAARIAETNSTITAEQAGTLAAQVQERAATTTELGAHRTSLHSQNAAATTAFSATADALTAGVSTDISAKLTEARRAADAELAAAGGAAVPAQGSGRPVVVRSWWNDVKATVGVGLSALANVVGSVVSAVRDRVNGLLERAMSFVRDRVRRFATAIATAARDTAARVAAAGRQACGWMRDRVRAGLARINALAHRLAITVRNVAVQLSSRITGLLTDLKAKLVAAYEAASTAVNMVLDAADVVRMFLRLMADNVLSALVQIVRDPMAVVMKAKGVIGEMIARVPAEIASVLAEHVAPKLGQSSVQARANVVGNAAGREGQQAAGQLVPGETAAESQPEDAGVTHGAGIEEHLAERVKYLQEHYWEVIKDGLFEALVPGVAVYRHLPVMWDEIVASWNAFHSPGQASEGWDHVLAVGRELMAIVASVVAQASLVVFIIVSVFGTPVAGEAALVALGLAVIEVDLALQIATILKSASNLSERSPVPVLQPANETDYGRIADATIASAFMLVLLAIGSAASSAAKSLLARFPAIGEAVSAARARLRKTVGLKPIEKPGTKPMIPAEEGKPKARLDDEGPEGRGKGGPAEEAIPEGITNDDVHIEDLNEPARVPSEPDVDVSLCFPADTLVATPSGRRAIEDVQAGQLVYAFDFDINEVVPRRVLGLTRGITARWIAIDLGTESLRATPGHPFWSDSTRTWIKAEELTPGVTLRRYDGGAAVVAEVAEVGLDQPEVTCNFSVDKVENYFVGALAVLVHNITPTRLRYLRRKGYKNYVLVDKNKELYYSGMCREEETTAGLMRRHGANGNRFNFDNGDRVQWEPGIREYFEARLMELRTALKKGLIIGRNSLKGQRGNIQRPIAEPKEPEYRKAETRKSKCG
ncbi:Hint domain-containing protein [Rhodococcus wratislaviensis]|uniref:Hint domain-containing protein n=1 Tax=Rhodococcus wratislaviensis TaxID=44752 RepID=UPI001788A531|nr:Hint domain-containing protein [Rhodococcus wratislaviensis]